jgi:hypothetical protein
MKDLEKRFEIYDFKVDVPDKAHFDPLNEAVEVVLTTRTGERYSANFVTVKYIPWVFEKNRRTGECDNGAWWGMDDNMLVVREIDFRNIKLAIDAVIERRSIEKYFKKII